MSIFDHIEGFFEELNMASVAVRLILATLLGSFVGMERAHKRYAAGIRTFALVCLGSALATMIGLYLGEISALGADVGRIPAQILCGIGFLGAGTIIVTERKQVKGLTTAAGLWVTATMGMAIGAGFVFADFPHHLLYVLYGEVCGESYQNYRDICGDGQKGSRTVSDIS